MAAGVEFAKDIAAYFRAVSEVEKAIEILVPKCLDVKGV
jgi:hypothetical protein